LKLPGCCGCDRGQLSSWGPSASRHFVHLSGIDITGASFCDKLHQSCESATCFKSHHSSSPLWHGL